ncbi:MAG: hypothetical protein FJ096_17750 [Deltaproteobacteria bacterium]|nr:hypothetical protein [Deltaproteobacteria bacterium]
MGPSEQVAAERRVADEVTFEVATEEVPRWHEVERERVRGLATVRGARGGIGAQPTCSSPGAPSFHTTHAGAYVWPGTQAKPPAFRHTQLPK